MKAQAFWNVIGNYNEQTKIIQIGLLIFVILAIALSYMRKGPSPSALLTPPM